jgi:hypothetical protein
MIFGIEVPEFWSALYQIKLTLKVPDDFSLDLSPVRDSSMPFDGGTTEVDWTQVAEVSSDTLQFLEKLAAMPKQAVQSSTLKRPVFGLQVYTYDWLPDSFFEELEKVRKVITDGCFKVLKHLLWRIGIHCGPSHLESDLWDMEFSLNGVDYVSLPVRLEFTAQLLEPEERIPVMLDFSDGLSSIKEPPVHHLLFKEAWTHFELENRVCIVMAAAAVEVAVKHLVSELQPQTCWLLDNTASPPVIKMLRELVDNLPVKCRLGDKVRPPNETIDKIRHLIECRNRIVHRATCDLPGNDVIREWISATRDMLWLVDYYTGQEWAAKYISPPFVEALRK